MRSQQTIGCVTHRAFAAGCLFALCTLQSARLLSESIPPERPRSRPPSELTGWADWEKAAELWKKFKVPPAPVLSPEEAMKTFRVAPGYRLELVAAEPMVQNPIFFEFDPDGRIWVVEYQGYMRDLQGSGEGDPICRVVVLQDEDEDGRADKSTVFLDKLVMPRSLSFVKGGVLVAEPPKLWFCQDANGDLRCDQKVQVGTYGHAGNPQHTANGLRYGIDNWLHSADIARRHRFVDGKLIEEQTIHRGQFGVTFDDFGRYMTCYEGSAIHADLIPAEYLLRNKNYLKAFNRGGRDRGQFGVNVNIARDAQEVYPIRVTPAITLGALELRDDGRLRTYTIVAGSSYYNGDQFPADAYGNIFVPEAGGHLIGRLKTSGNLEPKATRFYPPEQEFLASTDERFRPVNSRVGPDGALYIADMYHGIIEHVIFLVPYLNEQIKERRLEEGNDMGRIYRIVHEGKPINRKRPQLSRATSKDLINHLSRSNGWWRLTAQRLLVEGNDKTIIPALKQLAADGSNPLGRMHALWTLNGMEAVEWELIEKCFRDTDEQVRATAVRLSGGFWSAVAERSTDTASDSSSPSFKSKAVSPLRSATALQNLQDGSSPLVRLHLLLTLGGLDTADARNLMVQMVTANDHYLFRSAAMTGLQGKELEFLEQLLADWKQPRDHRRQTLVLLAQAVTDEGSAKRIEALFSHIGDSLQWPSDAILEGILAVIPRDLQNVRPIALSKEPAVFPALARLPDFKWRERASRLRSYFTWPGAEAVAARTPTSLTAEERRLEQVGSEQFGLVCAPCHQPHGMGLPNVAPSLAGSEWVAGPAERLARIVLHGLYGPIEVSGEPWNLHMPGFASALNDEQVAGVLTYIRRAWGNAAAPVEPKLVANIRRETESRTLAWTPEELGNAREAIGRAIRPNEKGELLLHARSATTYGRALAYRPALDILAPWRHKEDVAEWRVEAPAGGSFEVFVTLAADDASAGDKFIIENETSKTIGTVKSSGWYDRFHEYSCGKLQLRAGLNRVLVRPEGSLKRELADIRAVKLVRADSSK